MQKFSSFGRKKKGRPKFDIEWLCSGIFNCEVDKKKFFEASMEKKNFSGLHPSEAPKTFFSGYFTIA